MKNCEKVKYDWVKKEYIEEPPIWCSVDLRDGNQALSEMMSLEEKLEIFRLLVKSGFKEIEVGFPAVSEAEYEFVRTLIEKNVIPEDVTIQVLTQANEHIIKRTIDAVKGATHVIIHLHNSASEDVIEGAVLLKKLAGETEGNFTFQYSSEGFSGMEVECAVDICNTVLDVWKPTKDKKVIVSIPTTIEKVLPHVFASQVEFVDKNLKYRDGVIFSLDLHNGDGYDVAMAEMGVIAGAERIEGMIFGNSEFTGGVGLSALAMNMFSYGVDPKLDFSDMEEIRQTYEKFTKKHMYAGQLYTGVSRILKQDFGISVPEKMQEEVDYLVKDISDKVHKELTPEWVYHIFEEYYVNYKGIFTINECNFKQEDGIEASVDISHANGKRVVTASGNGHLDAVSNAIKQYFGISYVFTVYEEYSITKGSSYRACSYVSVVCNDKTYWGVGMDVDIVKAAIEALTVAVNKVEEIKKSDECKEERLVEIMNYIQANYFDISLDDLAGKFFLSKPYLSKYIKEKSGMTFGDIVKEMRMKKARALLKSSSMTVEKIALSVGYQNVEHFNRLFKKAYNMTPVQFRNQK